MCRAVETCDAGPKDSAPAPGPRLRRCRCGTMHVMVPLLSLDLARAGTVTCAMAHAAGALRALPGRVDGGAAAAGGPRRAPPGPPRKANLGQPPARTRQISRERDHLPNDQGFVGVSYVRIGVKRMSTRQYACKVNG